MDTEAQKRLEENRKKAGEFLREQAEADAADPNMVGQLGEPRTDVVADLGSDESEAFPGREPEPEEGDGDAKSEAVQVPEEEQQSTAFASLDEEAVPPEAVTDEGVTFVAPKKKSMVVFGKSGQRIGKFENGTLTVTDKADIEALDVNPHCYRVGEAMPAEGSILVGSAVRIARHFVERTSPYEGGVGTVTFTPPDGIWPYVVAIPDGDTATSDPGAPWPTVFSRQELEPVDSHVEDESEEAS